MKSNEQRRDEAADRYARDVMAIPEDKPYQIRIIVGDFKAGWEAARADMLKNPPEEMAVLFEMSNPKSEWYWKIMPKDGKPGETKSIYDIAMAIKSALKAFDATVVGNVNVEARKE